MIISGLLKMCTSVYHCLCISVYPFHYDGFSEDWHRRRFSVRPGITCLWQINGRSDTSFEEWMEMDMEYIDNWTLWMDLKILLLTVPAALKGSGAV